ncbi:MAG: hypothetical protein GXP28_10705 [Planctomycetes bacterium]|nr:hypothetical protein [Planctomycetota bacterium]
MRFGPGKKQLLTLVAMVAVLSSAAWQWLPTIAQWNHRQLASQIAQNIEKGRHDAGSEPARRLADLGTPALTPLVILASSQRTSVARQARQTLDEEFATWQTRAAVDRHFDLATPMTALASALVSQADRFDASGKRWATSLAIRMVDLTESLSTDDAMELLGECNQILAAIPPQGPRLRSLPETTQQPWPATASRLQVPEVRIDLLAVPSESAREIFSPKGDIQIVDTPKNIPEPAISEIPDSKFSQWSPKWNTKSNAQKSSLRPIDSVALRSTPLKKLANEVVEVPTPLEMERRQKALRKVPSRVLITQLPKAGHYGAGSIRVVLRQRGFVEAEWALAELFSSPHMEDRNQLVEAVSALPAGNARRWLRWLLQDVAAEVRLRALTALATTNDPQLFRLAREMAVADQDTRVSELASQIMRQVR